MGFLLFCFTLFSQLMTSLFSKGSAALSVPKTPLHGTSLAVQHLGFCLPRQQVWVRCLLGELRFHMRSSQKNQNIKQKQYCNKFNKDFKNSPRQKNHKKKHHSIASDIPPGVRGSKEAPYSFFSCMGFSQHQACYWLHGNQQ